MKTLWGINWMVRFKNPAFWAQIACAVFLPILTYYGVSWEVMTSWPTLGQYLVSAFANPVVVVAILVSVWNSINDPTTKGMKDSQLALGKDGPTD